jgi:hypothetical protein
MPDGGDVLVGGNGSVEWSVEVGNANWTLSTPKVAGGHIQAGVEKSSSANPGELFSISIRLPTVNPTAWLDKLKGTNAANGRLEFTLPIEKETPDQVRVKWGNGGA